MRQRFTVIEGGAAAARGGHADALVTARRTIAGPAADGASTSVAPSAGRRASSGSRLGAALLTRAAGRRPDLGRSRLPAAGGPASGAGAEPVFAFACGGTGQERLRAAVAAAGDAPHPLGTERTGLWQPPASRLRRPSSRSPRRRPRRRDRLPSRIGSARPRCRGWSLRSLPVSTEPWRRRDRAAPAFPHRAATFRRTASSASGRPQRRPAQIERISEPGRIRDAVEDVPAPRRRGLAAPDHRRSVGGGHGPGGHAAVRAAAAGHSEVVRRADAVVAVRLRSATARRAGVAAGSGSAGRRAHAPVDNRIAG